MKSHFNPVSALKGKFAPPADKSISHRAALFSAMCDEPVTICNYLDSEDTHSTLNAIQALGAAVDQYEGTELVIRGVGLRTPAEVTGGTLYTLLRRLTREGTLEKRELPGGQTGYAIAASAASGAEGAATERAATTIEPGIDAEPGPASETQQGGAVEG